MSLPESSSDYQEQQIDVIIGAHTLRPDRFTLGAGVYSPGSVTRRVMEVKKFAGVYNSFGTIRVGDFDYLDICIAVLARLTTSLPPARIGKHLAKGVYVG